VKVAVPKIEAKELGKVKHFRRQGEFAELTFMQKAFSLGFSVSKPYGESARYDFIVDSGSRLVRIQVKSVRDVSRQISNYKVTVVTGRERRPYTTDEIDFVAAYVIPEDIWYMVPVKAINGNCLLLAPQIFRSRGRWEQYREAWQLLR
jgi:hypothetical protein